MGGASVRLMRIDDDFARSEGMMVLKTLQGNNATDNITWNEIDIGVKATAAGGNGSTVSMNLRADYFNDAVGTDHLYLKVLNSSSTPAVDWAALHTFKVVWTPSNLTWLVDEAVVAKKSFSSGQVKDSLRGGNANCNWGRLHSFLQIGGAVVSYLEQW